MYRTLAHVKWFSTDSQLETVDSLVLTEWTVVFLVILAGILLMYFVDKIFKPFDKILDDKLSRWRNWVPTVVRYSTAVFLIFNYWNNIFFASNIDYSNDTPYTVVTASLILVALGLIFGVYTRLAGVILLASYVLAFLSTSDPVQLLDHLVYLGIGLFLLYSEAGKLSLASVDFKTLTKLKSNAWLATPLLKTFIGLGLIIMAFSEKLLNLTLANNFLLDHDWNVLSSFGMSDRNFIIMAAIIEILIGLTLVLNLASRLGVLVLASTMVLTAFLLGYDEVFGHLFAVGLAATVWVGPNIKLFKKPSLGLPKKPA